MASDARCSSFKFDSRHTLSIESGPCRADPAAGLSTDFQIYGFPMRPMSMKIKLFAAALLFLPLMATAALLPQPEAGAIYNQADPAARATHAAPGGKAKFRERLNKRLIANPKDVVALTQRAYLFHVGGDIEQGDRDYQRVFDLTEPGSELRRRALWSLGWSLFNRGLPDQALGYFQQAAKQHGGQPFWYAYTLAVVTWQLGDHEVAVRWYDAAVRGNHDWADAQGLKRNTAHWREQEKRIAGDVFQAWAKQQAATEVATSGF